MGSKLSRADLSPPRHLINSSLTGLDASDFNLCPPLERGRRLAASVLRSGFSVNPKILAIALGCHRAETCHFLVEKRVESSDTPCFHRAVRVRRDCHPLDLQIFFSRMILSAQVVRLK